MQVNTPVILYLPTGDYGVHIQVFFVGMLERLIVETILPLLSVLNIMSYTVCVVVGCF